jgi:hypothetical protein
MNGIRNATEQCQTKKQILHQQFAKTLEGSEYSGTTTPAECATTQPHDLEVQERLAN